MTLSDGHKCQTDLIGDDPRYGSGGDQNQCAQSGSGTDSAMRKGFVSDNWSSRSETPTASNTALLPESSVPWGDRCGHSRAV